MARFTDLLMEFTARGLKQMAEIRQESFGWFADKARKTRSGIKIEPGVKIFSENVIRQHPVDPNHTFQIGAMCIYKYDPKYKITLPYYDMYPVVFPIYMYPDGFLGINMHYIPPLYRATLMDALYTTLQPQSSFNAQDVLAINYNILSSATRFKNFRPCIKRYLNDHIRSNIVVLPLVEWDSVLFLPVASWRKANESRVFTDSINIIRKY